MEQIIAIAKYIGPTDKHGSQIQVRYLNRRKRVAIDYSWDSDNLNREAIAELFRIPIANVGYGGIDGHYIVTIPDAAFKAIQED